jgi:hypothetical protein
MKKKELPLAILSAISVTKQLLRDKVANNPHLEIISEDLTAISIIDNDPDSTFRFDVESAFLMKNDRMPVFRLKIKPFSNTYIEAETLNVPAKEVPNYFEDWETFIAAYNSIVLTPEDAIIKTNQERFLQEFDIVEEDSQTSTFDLQQQLYLEEYLDNAIKIIEEFKKLPNADIDGLEELTNDVVGIKNNITKDTKKVVVNKLTKFWAKAQVVGLEVIKEIFVKYITELTVKLITGQ